MSAAVLRQAQDNHLRFRCPGCDAIHQVRHGEGPRPRWAWNGDLVHPTLSPSILVRWPYGDPPQERVCHSFVTDGRIQFLGDCTHALAGQTVDLPAWDSQVQR